MTLFNNLHVSEKYPLNLAATLFGKAENVDSVQLLRQIDRLPGDDRDLIALHYKYGLTMEKSAERMNMKIGTAQGVKIKTLTWLRHPNQASRIQSIPVYTADALKRKLDAATAEHSAMSELLLSIVTGDVLAKDIVLSKQDIKDMGAEKLLPEFEAYTSLLRPIEEYDFSNRNYLHMKRAGIHTIEDIMTYTQAELRKIHGMGDAPFVDLLAVLELHGVQLKPEVKTSENV